VRISLPCAKGGGTACHDGGIVSWAEPPARKPRLPCHLERSVVESKPDPKGSGEGRGVRPEDLAGTTTKVPCKEAEDATATQKSTPVGAFFTVRLLKCEIITMLLYAFLNKQQAHMKERILPQEALRMLSSAEERREAWKMSYSLPLR